MRSRPGSGVNVRAFNCSRALFRKATMSASLPRTARYLADDSMDVLSTNTPAVLPATSDS
ncbi:hypothetical protein RKD32_000019 [Streptomyces sp. SAI-195]|uniref:hypothetical protein n=1 Tax=unclassified Streptomyces TaxID=2593676 RepID=UPI003422AC65